MFTRPETINMRKMFSMFRMSVQSAHNVGQPPLGSHKGAAHMLNMLTIFEVVEQFADLAPRCV